MTQCKLLTSPKAVWPATSIMWVSLRSLNSKRRPEPFVDTFFLIKVLDTKFSPHFLGQVFDHFFDILLPKSGMAEPDRQLLKEKTSKHEIYRTNSGNGDCSWMARMQKSAIETFHLLEARPCFIS